MTRIRVVHRSGYDYDPWAMASHNEARMAPKTTPAQLVLSHKIEVSPTAWQHAYTDYWGTSVLAFEIHEKHPRLMIAATSEVDVTRSTPQLKDADTVSWDDLADESVCDGLCEYLEPTPQTDVTSVLGDVVAQLRAGCETPADFVRALQSSLTERISFRARSFGHHRHATEAWTSGEGMGRDLTHLMAGGLRLAGVPARYVSGYCLPASDPEVGVAMGGESHSWIDYWAGHWASLDPSSGRVPDDFYIEVAHGRDYYDVPPLSGIFTGVRTASQFGEVLLTRLS